MDDPLSRTTTAFLNRRTRLDQSPGVREEDLRLGCVSLVGENGERLRVFAAEIALPPVAGFPTPGALYKPRLLVEELLRLGFDDRWMSMIVERVNRVALFDYPGKAPA